MGRSSRVGVHGSENMGFSMGQSVLVMGLCRESSMSSSINRGAMAPLKGPFGELQGNSAIFYTLLFLIQTFYSSGLFTDCICIQVIGKVIKITFKVDVGNYTEPL